MNTGKNKKPIKAVVEPTDAEKVALYAKAPYFHEKDKKAIAFLKKHPLPLKLPE